MYLSPKIKNLGLGVLAEIKIIDRMFFKHNIHTIWGEVFPDNRNILRIHEKCGFKVIKDCDDILMISMTRDGWNGRKDSIVKEFALK